MTHRQAQVSPPKSGRRRVLFRIAAILLVLTLLGAITRFASAALERNRNPAGFFQGLLQGALMPCALPNLLVGKDVVIYTQHNAGVPYKLGYTTGVNACGAIFFGVFFWRLNRWRKRLNLRSDT